jgi:hypothetical protein
MLFRRRFFLLAVASLLVICAAPAVHWVLDRLSFIREQRVAYESVWKLRDRRPAEINPDTWEWATSWAITAYCNVSFSPEHLSVQELKQFHFDLEERLRAPVDLKTVDWVWDRLGRTGPYGQMYRERYELQYREGLVAAERQR